MSLIVRTTWREFCLEEPIMASYRMDCNQRTLSEFFKNESKEFRAATTWSHNGPIIDRSKISQETDWLDWAEKLKEGLALIRRKDIHVYVV